MICVECKQDLPRENSGQKSTTGRSVFVNAEGRSWNGLTCPDCKNAFKLRPADLNPVTKRKCRGCGALLLATCYFKCGPCQSRKDTYTGFIESDFGYGHNIPPLREQIKAGAF